MRKQRVAAAKSPHAIKNIRVILWLKPLTGAILFYAFLPLSQALRLASSPFRRAIKINFANLIKSLSFQGEVAQRSCDGEVLNLSATADTLIPHS